ncbi:hypothetical protein A4G19_10610 [Pasteurellaceae bacterium Macca]|nr:hypothetical protein [Pasteurellaceae bacterium Macca]MCK3656175.1 hypothetical protein [Pasteurellaceae bacterium Macca]
MLTPQDFLSRYPQFEEKKLDDNLIELFLSDAKTEISESRWGKHYARGVLALTAHFATVHLWGIGSEGDPHRLTASESVGELSVSYTAPTLKAGEESYHTTAFGQEYLRLRKLVSVGVMVA